MHKGVTLIELMVALALLGVILLTAATLDVAARKFFNASDRVAEMQCEVSPVLMSIKKDINSAVGQPAGNSGIVIDNANNRIAIRRDVDHISGDPNNSAADYNDDTWMIYDLVGNQIQFYRDPAPQDWTASGNTDIVANRVTAFTLTPVDSVSIANYRIGAQVAITACYNPTGVAPDDCGTVNNPQITLGTSAHALSQSAR